MASTGKLPASQPRRSRKRPLEAQAERDLLLEDNKRVREATRADTGQGQRTRRPTVVAAAAAATTAVAKKR